MKKILIVLGILMIAVFLVGCGKKVDTTKSTDTTQPAAPTNTAPPAATDSTPIDKDMASLDAELNVDSAGSDLANLDKDLDNL